ncbi:alpha-farnesene synthase isoform X1 [Lactuca sativa]|nr:alpha-farnesene synthase isoform X1 [Lactuca sativa]
MTTEAIGIINQCSERRSADYKPNIWNYDFLQSLKSEFHEEEYRLQVQKARDEVKSLFVETLEPVAKLELIDDVEKLGLIAYFQKEINGIIDSFQSFKDENGYVNIESDLYGTSLCFRILRLHGFNISQGMFKGFVENVEKNMKVNVKAMVSLFEASHLALEGEDILGKARALASLYLKNVYQQLDVEHGKEIYDALRFPLNMRVEWFNIRSHIQGYAKVSPSNSNLLKLAKLNFNMVQAVHQSELKDMLSWWKKVGVMKNLSFTRNRVVESYLWSVGVAFEPQYGYLRKCLTKVINLVLIIDDVYDVFGTLDELETFTHIIERWATEGTERLPEPMKFCLNILYDTVDEISNELLSEKGYMVKTYLQNAWKDFCKGLLAEARWYHNGYTPGLHEYLDNGWVTSCGPLLSIHTVFWDLYERQEEAINFLKINRDLVYNTSMIIRLCNDQGTSKAELSRGDAPTSIMCHMTEANVTEEVAKKFIKRMITDVWTQINNVSTSLSPSIKHITNMARVAHFIYHNGDGFGIQDRETRDQVLVLLVHPLAVD